MSLFNKTNDFIKIVNLFNKTDDFQKNTKLLNKTVDFIFIKKGKFIQ